MFTLTIYNYDPDFSGVCFTEIMMQLPMSEVIVSNYDYTPGYLDYNKLCEEIAVEPYRDYCKMRRRNIASKTNWRSRYRTEFHNHFCNND